MLWMTYLVGAGVLMVLAYPIVGGPRESWDMGEAPDRLRYLQRARDRVLRTLKDIEHDRREGSLLESDYEQLHATYKREAIGLSRELNRVRETAVRRIADGPDGPLGKDERRRLEELVRKRRKRIGG